MLPFPFWSLRGYLPRRFSIRGRLHRLPQEPAATSVDFDRLLRPTASPLNTDRYDVALAWLPRGSGPCLDACSAHPRPDVREAVTAAGYDYLPIDIEALPGVQREDLTRLSFGDGTISCVLSVDTLEHIPDWRVATREIFRVLKPGGVAVIHVPCGYFDRAAGQPLNPRLDRWGHVRDFAARELLAAYQTAGFANVRTALLFDYGALLSVLTKG